MSKYGNGLSFEFASAVKQGLINQPFNSNDVKEFAKGKGWKPSPNYISVILVNSASEKHSLSYKKYYISIGNGLYKLSDLAKREC